MENDILFKILSFLLEDRIYDKYKDIFLKNAVIYSIEKQDFLFLDIVFNDINNLKKNLDNNNKFKVIVITKFLMNVFNNTNCETYKFNEKNNNKIINCYKDLFDKLNKTLNEKTTIITKKYRELLLDFINKYKEKEISSLKLFDLFIFSNKYDEAFVKSTNYFIEEKELKKYKQTMIRLILSDSLLYNEMMIFINKEIDEQFELLPSDINCIILDYLYMCINKNEYFLPKNLMLRENIYYDFLDLNYKYNDVNKILNIINNDEEKVFKIKKMNPFFMIENNFK